MNRPSLLKEALVQEGQGRHRHVVIAFFIVLQGLMDLPPLVSYSGIGRKGISVKGKEVRGDYG